MRKRAPGGGRKPLDPSGQTRTCHIGVRVTQREAELIREMGGLSKIVRAALEQAKPDSNLHTDDQ